MNFGLKLHLGQHLLGVHLKILKLSCNLFAILDVGQGFHFVVETDILKTRQKLRLLLV